MGLFRDGVAFHSSQWLSAVHLFAHLRATKIRRPVSSSSLLPIVFFKNHKSESLSISNPLGPLSAVIYAIHWARSCRMDPMPAAARGEAYDT